MSRKPDLTGEQERQRMDGLRALARVIARHYLTHPELYPAPIGDGDERNGGVGKDDATVNAPERAGGNADRKEDAK